MRSFDAVVLTNADHFLMLNRVQEFNRALERTVGTIVAARVLPEVRLTHFFVMCTV